MYKSKIREILRLVADILDDVNNENDLNVWNGRNKNMQICPKIVKINKLHTSQ